MKSAQSWRIERKIPLAIIFTLLLQMAIIIAWATQLDARVSNLEIFDAGQRETREHMARFEERMDGLRRDVSEIKRQLDVLLQQILPARK